MVQNTHIPLPNQAAEQHDIRTNNDNNDASIIESISRIIKKITKKIKLEDIILFGLIFILFNDENCDELLLLLLAYILLDL